MATSTSTTTSSLPEFSAPYVTDLLAKGSALTNGEQYQPYTGPRVAGLNPLQTGANQSLSGLNAGNAISQGNSLTMQGANYTPNTGSFGDAEAQQYMNPYARNVTDIAKTEAARNSNIQGTYDDSKAAQAGAFGGSRHAIVDAERERNLNQNLSNLDQQGLAAAYANAQTQYNADQNRQQQDAQFGSQAALKGGAQMLDTGAKTYGLQQLAGAQEQGQEQKAMDVGYQNFLNEQQHPYQQLSYMKDLLSGYGTQGNLSKTENTADPVSQNNWLTDTGKLLSGGKDVWDTVSSWFAQGGPVKSGLGHGRVAQLYGGLK
jgi:hypothetical protein